MIKFKNVSKHFFSRSLYSDINIEIPLNQMTFIVGKSGSGKTTLINMIGGLEKNYQGQIVLETDDRVMDLRNRKDTNLISFVFQHYNLFEKLSVLNNLKVSSNINGVKWNKKEAMKKLQDYDFETSIYKTKASELSGGEQQKVSLIRALDRDSKILLVDEPTGNLDEENTRKIFEELKKVSESRTVIVITHDEESALKYGDNIFSIENGTIVQTRKSNIIAKEVDVFDKPKVKRSFFSKLSAMPSLTFSDIRKRKITFSLLLTTLFLLIISLLLFSFVYVAVFDVRTNQLSSLNLDKAVVRKVSETNQNDLGWNKKDTEWLEKNPEIKYVMDDKAPTETAKLSYNGVQISNDKDLKFYFEDIIDNDFFKNRLKTNGLIGNTAQNKNELVLGKSFAEKMVKPGQKLESLIGQNVVLLFSNNPEDDINKLLKRTSKEKKYAILPPTTLKIVGINTNKRFDGAYLNYVNQDLWGLGLVGSDAYIILRKSLPSSSKDIQVKLEVETGSEKILPGDYQLSGEKMLISKAVDDEIKKFSNVKNNLINVFFSIVDSEKNLGVGGVFDSKDLIVKLPQKEIDKIQNDAIKKKIYINPNANLTTVFDKIRVYTYNSKIKFYLPKYAVDENLTATRLPKLKNNGLQIYYYSTGGLYVLFLMVGVVSVITFAIMLNSAKKRDMAIMKLLGAKLWQLILYSFGSMIVALAMLLGIAIVAGFGLSQIVYNHILEYSSHVYIHYDRIAVVIFWTWFVMSMIFLAIFIIVSFISTWLSYRKIKAYL